MSKYYGETLGYNSKGSGSVASRCGHTSIRSAAQSWDGSVIVILRDKYNYELAEDKTDIPIVNVEISDNSSIYGDKVFSGTIEELKDVLLKYMEEKENGNIHNS